MRLLMDTLLPAHLRVALLTIASLVAVVLAGGAGTKWG